MNKEFLIDVFRLYWDVILEESVINENWINETYFNSEHCKILDTTDTNFDILENRLAYTYKYGCYNTLIFENCVLNFLHECSDFEEVFPPKKLKVCSLSNGPGFDIIGLLCALCRSNKPLKSFPKLNAVNIFSSWLTLYQTLINKACKNINLKFTDYIKIKPENVSLFQGDILLSTLPLEAKKCISKSNVLLMAKTYFSSKVTVNKFACSLKKIFLLLRPGTLIFFIGSKKDMNNFSRRPFLSNYVKTIYGPQTVILEDITVDENMKIIFSGDTGQKPVTSGHEEFVVWQKRDGADMEASIKDFKENIMSKRSQKKSACSHENSFDELLNEDGTCDYSSDFESKLSYATSEESKDNLNLKYVASTSTIAKFTADTDCLSWESASESSVKETREKEITDQHYKVNDHFEDSLNSQNDPKTAFTKIMSPFAQSCENISLHENILHENLATRNIKRVSEDLYDKEASASSLNLLIQQCENLVKALEKLTISLRNDIESSKSHLKEKKHCSGQIIRNSEISHQCCCCVTIMHACCCKKKCNC